MIKETIKLIPKLHKDKMKEVFIYKFTLFAILFILGQTSTAQVTIGTTSAPEKGALLQIKDREATNPSATTDASNITANKGGLGLPRVQLVDKRTLEPFIQLADPMWLPANIAQTKIKHVGLTIYNIKVSADTETDENKILSQGVYTWDGSKWSLAFQGKKFFPCPAFNLPLPRISTPTDPEFTYDLYAEYAKQFTESINNKFISNNSSLNIIAPQNRKKLYKENELDFVVTYYDESVLQITGIDKNGVMSYHILNHAPDADAFINLIFVIKE